MPHRHPSRSSLGLDLLPGLSAVPAPERPIRTAHRDVVRSIRSDGTAIRGLSRRFAVRRVPTGPTHRAFGRLEGGVDRARAVTAGAVEDRWLRQELVAHERLDLLG